jgi:hypothetical protein
MAGIGTRKLGDAQQALGRKGFRLLETHHAYYVLHVDNKPTQIRTYFSHKNTGKDLWDNEVNGMKNQMKFSSPKELFQFIDCDISEAAYVQLLRERGHIPPEEAEETPE